MLRRRSCEPPRSGKASRIDEPWWPAWTVTHNDRADVNITTGLSAATTAHPRGEVGGATVRVAGEEQTDTGRSPGHKQPEAAFEDRPRRRDPDVAG